ncbi:SEC-C metal-binding domain-containing protein [soil metagenome]
MQMLDDGPVPMDDVLAQLDSQALLDDLREDGLTDEELADAVVHEVVITNELWLTPDRTLVRTDHLLDGTVLTHRLTETELADEEVAASPDLVVLDFDARGQLELNTGGDLRFVLPAERRPGYDDTVIAGPPGWLDGFGAGDVVAFRRHGRVVTLEQVAPEVGEREVAMLTAAVDGRIPPGGAEEALPLVLDALTMAPTTFRRPTHPVGELLAAAGLECRGFSYGRRGQPWRSFAEEVAERDRGQLTDEWQLESCCALAVEVVWTAYSAFRGDGELDDPPVVGEALAHGAAAAALAALVVERDEAADRLADFARAVLASSRGRRRAAPLFVVGVAAELSGDAITAEASFAEALREDDHYGLAALQLAPYAVDRGDLSRALTLLRHPDLHGGDRSTLAFLEEQRDQLRAPFRRVGRNEPCPCGSGRKFKTCCDHDPHVPLSARTGLLTFKLSDFITAPHRRSRLVGVASSACDPADPDLLEQVRTMARSELIADFVIFEGGGADKYLVERGHLLPADERALVEELTDTPRALWEVVGVERGRSIDLRDTKTGDRVVVTERTASQDAEVGGLVLARVARLSDQCQLIGIPVTVPLRLRDSALGLVDSHPDADDLAMWYGEAIAFPQMATREGEPLVLCRCEVLMTLEPQELAAGLDEVFEGDDHGTWREMFELPNGERILRAHLRVEDDRLVIEANSEERLERVLDVVFAFDPDAEVDVDERTDPATAVRQRRASGEPMEPLEEPSPELREVVEDYLRQQEEAWLDESIPGLAGLTPRQAADDPTRREDLVAMLRDLDRMAEAPGFTGFDPDRLRAQLGIET